MFEPSLFDRMQTASLLEGPQVSIRGATPVFHRFITTGNDPFLSVYHASEVTNVLINVLSHNNGTAVKHSYSYYFVK